MTDTELLNRLHDTGAAMAMIIDDRWVGIRATDGGKWCVVSGLIGNIWSYERHCYCPSYEAAMSVFQEWWNKGFAGRPECPYIAPVG